jgi:sensor domain CHASE-containing protein
MGRISNVLALVHPNPTIEALALLDFLRISSTLDHPNSCGSPRELHNSPVVAHSFMRAQTPENRKILSESEFNIILYSVFKENEIHWILKHIWRASS